MNVDLIQVAVLRILLISKITGPSTGILVCSGLRNPVVSRFGQEEFGKQGETTWALRRQVLLRHSKKGQ